jgi:PAS domain S-box-containing protein
VWTAGGIALVLFGVLAWTLFGDIRPRRVDRFLSDWLYRILIVGAAVAVLMRAALFREQRLAWTFIGLGFAFWAAGDIYYDLALSDRKQIPYPSFADALYILDYLALLAGLRLLATRGGRPAFSLGLVVSILGLATVWSVLVFNTVASTAAGGTAAVATTLAYPLFDLALMTATLVALATRGWVLDRTFIALAVAFGLTAVADSIYAVQVAQGTYADGAVPTMFWIAGALMGAVAAWAQPRPIRARDPAGLPGQVLTVLAIAVAITALVWDHFDQLGDVSVILAGLTLIAASVQLILLNGERRRAMERALAAERLQSASSRGALDCVVTIDTDLLVQQWNDAAERTFGYPRERALGVDIAELIAPPAEREIRRDQLREMVATDAGPLLDRRNEITCADSDGVELPVELAITKVQDEPAMYSGFIRDISDRKRGEVENERLAAIVRSSDDAILSMDLTGVVTAWNRGAETLYGYGAQEAIGEQMTELIVPPDRAAEMRDELERIAEGEPVAYESERRSKDGRRLRVSLRAFPIRDLAGHVIGASATARDITDRLRREEEARRDHEARLWRQRIEDALAEDRIVFWGQPVSDRLTGAIDHYELLVRMNLDGEIVTPNHFLPHAERGDLIRKIDRRAVAVGIDLARTTPVAINLSAKSVDDPQLVGAIERHLAKDVNPANVTFEITETAAVENLSAAGELVTRLRQLGCGISLDDFGTGYGSFTYLKHLPVTELKIDIQFTRGLVDDPADRRVVRSMLAVARNFDIRTVAEGVEDEATLELLRELGVDLLQGYYIGRPAPMPPPDRTAAPRGSRRPSRSRAKRDRSAH